MSKSYLTTISKKLTNLKTLKQFHAHLIHISLSNQNPWPTRLLTLCTRFHAPPSYTRLIFDSVNQPDVSLFTHILRYYSKFGANDDIIKLYRKMQSLCLKPDAFSYSILIKAAEKNGFLFHSETVEIGVVIDKYVGNALVNFYGKYGPAESGRRLFDEMPERSVVDWNAVISGYWNWGCEDEAKGLFDLMRDRNVVTWTCMVSGYSKMNDLVNARLYFDRTPYKTVVSWNAMLSGYVQNGFWEEGLSLFDEMVGFGVRPNETTWVNVISACSSCGDVGVVEKVVRMIDEKGVVRLNGFVKTALIDLFPKCGRLEMAREIFDELGSCRNVVAWNSMISGYMRNGDLSSARELFDRMPEKDVVSWNAMIAGYAQNGESLVAIELFKEMVEKGVTPDEVTVVSVISACGHLGALELGNWVIELITSKNVKLSISGYNSLIFMYSRCGDMNEAKAIFHEMETRDVVSHNALITGFAIHGNGVEALELMRKMKDENMDPDRITYVGVLTACSHSGMLEEGKKVFESINVPDIDHYACIVDLMGRMGKLDDAKRIVEEMPMNPPAEIYGSLLNASQIHKRVDLGELAAHKLFELEPRNSGNYVLLSNMYAAAGKWKEVDRIRALMKTRGVRKTGGMSWLEHGKKIHRFMVGDRTHQYSIEIYSKLAELMRKMKGDGYIADKSNVLRDVEEEEKEEMVGTHSEKLAVAFGLIVSEPASVIRVVKNLRICRDCHTAISMISKLEQREIIVRDNNRFHCFKNGSCSCNDHW